MQLNKKKEGKRCIGGAKYAAKEYLPPPSKMSGVTFQFITSIREGRRVFFCSILLLPSPSLMRVILYKYFHSKLVPVLS